MYHFNTQLEGLITMSQVVNMRIPKNY